MTRKPIEILELSQARIALTQARSDLQIAQRRVDRALLEEPGCTVNWVEACKMMHCRRQNLKTLADAMVIELRSRQQGVQS